VAFDPLDLGRPVMESDGGADRLVDSGGLGLGGSCSGAEGPDAMGCDGCQTVEPTVNRRLPISVSEKRPISADNTGVARLRLKNFDERRGGNARG